MNLASGACRRNKNYMSIHLTNHKPFSPETEQKSRQNVTYIDDLSCFDGFLAQSIQLLLKIFDFLCKPTDQRKFLKTDWSATLGSKNFNTTELGVF